MDGMYGFFILPAAQATCVHTTDSRLTWHNRKVGAGPAAELGLT